MCLGIQTFFYGVEGMYNGMGSKPLMFPCSHISLFNFILHYHLKG